METTDGAVYIDSPIAAAVRQVAPFYRQGIFSNETCPMILRRRIGTAFGLLAPSQIDGVNIRTVNGSEAKRLPVRKGGVVFYTFNGQGNIHTVANRSYRHVLVLHGESNKRASARPASRLYDYVCVAGAIAADRYVEAGVFRRSDVAQGRLIRTGDSFVQDLTGCSVDPCNGDTILYAPTWEGYGGSLNDHSTVGTFGFAAVELAMKIKGVTKLLVRPHPYLGLLSPRLLSAFMRGILRLSGRYDVALDLSTANTAVIIASKITILRSGGRIARADGSSKVCLCLSDISGIESVCLKAGLPHVVLKQNFRTPDRIARHYVRKSVSSAEELTVLLPDYLENYKNIDLEHKVDTFSYSLPEMEFMDGTARLAAIRNLIAEDHYWNVGV